MAENKKKQSSINWYILGDCVIVIVAWTASFILQIYEASSQSNRAGLLGHTAFISMETILLIFMLAPGLTGVYAEIRASNFMMSLTFWLATIAVCILCLRTFIYFGMIIYTMKGPPFETSCTDSPNGCRCKNDTVWAGIFNTEDPTMTCSYAQNLVDRMILACSLNTLSWFALLMLVILLCCAKPK